VTDRLITADEFMTLDDENGVYLELVRGRLVRIVVPGFQHGIVSSRLALDLFLHVKTHRLGMALPRCSFKLESDPDTVRVPDFAFVSQIRVPAELSDSYFDGPPDLAGEVLCPTDPPALIREKISDYMRSAVRLLWIVDPREKSIAVHRPGAQPVTLREEGILEGGDVVPGFRCDVTRLFRDDI
jgi:Uma2 family endonuclease